MLQKFLRKEEMRGRKERQISISFKFFAIQYEMGA
jgi:hypothetical protein